MNVNKEVIDKMIQAIPPILGDHPLGLLMDDGGPQEPAYFEDIEEAILDIDGAAQIKYGMSKLVIVAPSLENIVIKIPFSGVYDFHYDDDYSYDEASDYVYYTDEGEWDFHEFNNVRSKDKKNKTDYCAVEAEKYQDLYSLDLDEFVAETHLYTELSNGIKVYIQEKALSSEDDPSWNTRKSSADSRATARKWVDEESIPLESNWIGLCIDVYGEDRTKAFLDYCNYEDPILISDTHCGNIGYREDGSPVLLDYSGFLD